MIRRIFVPALCALAVSPGVVSAQSGLNVRTAVLYESYTFDAGLLFNKVTEMTVPIAISFGLGRFGNLAISTGYAKAEITSTDPTQISDQQISGVLDTEARLSFDLIPGRLVGIVSGAVPTGTKTVAFEELSVLGAISSDLIGFSAANLGTGGNVGAGFAGAVPVGRMALGFGATFRKPLTYEPVLGRTTELRPGAEIRLRGGLEGAIATRTYIRLAAIYARREKDVVSDSTRNGVGNRIIGYVSLNQGLGSASVTVYGFDVFRGNPQLESTAAGAAILPRGNLLAAGLRFDFPLGRTTTVEPNVEYRVSDAAPDASTTSLERLGESFRYGVDLRIRATRRWAIVLQGGGISGYVTQSAARINFRGFRSALHLEFTP